MLVSVDMFYLSGMQIRKAGCIKSLPHFCFLDVLTPLLVLLNKWPIDQAVAKNFQGTQIRTDCKYTFHRGGNRKDH